VCRRPELQNSENSGKMIGEQAKCIEGQLKKGDERLERNSAMINCVSERALYARTCIKAPSK
jgi:hypothetical protein